MSAHLVEREPQAYARLATLPPRYPDIRVTTYGGDFLTELPGLLKAIPNDAFVFFLIDPKGWRIPLRRLSTLLTRLNSEVIFNFMFDFINRAASMTDPDTVAGLDELMPYGNWRQRLAGAEKAVGRPLTPDERKEILISAFIENLQQIGDYPYVVPTEILRPLRNRTLYCLFYATRHEIGLQEFRACQTEALDAQPATRATLKVQQGVEGTGQQEMFTSLHDMGPNEAAALRIEAKRAAEAAVLDLTPTAPNHILYKKLWPMVLTRHAVRRTDVNTICAGLRKREQLVFPDWEPRKRVPQDHYRVQRSPF